MYGKIYEQTFTGSMYGSGSHIFAVWSYVIAHTKPDAMVELNPMALASVLGEDISRIESAVEHFKSADPKSRSKEFDGRRLIQKGEFIYSVPQYHKYHGFANNKERREYFAQKKREQRQRDKDGQTVKSKVSKNVQQSDTESDTENKDNKDVGAKVSPPTFKSLNGLTDSDWLSQLIHDKTYQDIDVNREHGKMLNWCRANNKTPTRRRFVNWLNRSDRSVSAAKPDVPSPDPKFRHRKIREPNAEDFKNAHDVAKQEIANLRAKLRPA